MTSTEEMMPTVTSLMFLMAMYMITKNHIMSNLMIIEFATATILMLMFKTMMNLEMENYTILYFIVLVISESMLGLSTMISMIRTHSNDYTKSLTILKL